VPNDKSFVLQKTAHYMYVVELYSRSETSLTVVNLNIMTDPLTKEGSTIARCPILKPQNILCLTIPVLMGTALRNPLSRINMAKIARGDHRT